jgi:hypothetical protein
MIPPPVAAALRTCPDPAPLWRVDLGFAAEAPHVMLLVENEIVNASLDGRGMALGAIGRSELGGDSNCCLWLMASSAPTIRTRWATERARRSSLVRRIERYNDDPHV